MNYRKILNIIGHILWVVAAFMLQPLVIALYRGEWPSVRGFLLSIAILVVLGLIFSRITPQREGFHAREGLVSVGLAWVMISFLGGLPFFFSGSIPDLMDCFFEMVSGFTTTGATILRQVENMPASDLYWRCFTNWLGGMGVLVFVLAISPKKRMASTGDELHILRAESPGVTVDKLVPRMRRSATILYLIYIFMTIVQVVLLLGGGMSLYEALVTAFSTAGTGGFGAKNDSFVSYSPYIQWVVTIFMLLFSVNFNVYFFILLRQFRKAFFNEELRAFVCIVLVSVGLVAWNIFPYFDGFWESLRHAAFQVSSIISTTGFMSVDYDLWPAFSKSILVLLMFIGACAGSTGGGFKVARICILWKAVRRSIYRALHPNAVIPVHMDGVVVDDRIVNGTLGYLGIFVIIQAVSIVLISVDNFDFTSNFTAVTACFNNIGPGLAAVGPTQSFADYSYFSKLVLSLDMLLGRLELYPILALFIPASYKK